MFAIYQLNYAVFGTGATEADALADAREWTDDEPRIVDLHDAVDGDLVSLPCSQRLHDEVQANGGDVRVTIVDGALFLASEPDDDSDLEAMHEAYQYEVRRADSNAWELSRAIKTDAGTIEQPRSIHTTKKAAEAAGRAWRAAKIRGEL